MECEIDAVYFCVSSEEDIKRSSVVEITTTDLYTYDAAKKQIPAAGGLLDPRLGICGGRHGNRAVCATCAQKVSKCTGHWGHIQLREPMYNVGYIDIIMCVLNAVCFFCGSLYIDEEELESVNSCDRLKCASDYGKSNKAGCPNCFKLGTRVMKSPNPTGRGFLSVRYSEEDMESGLLYARKALEVLNRVTDSTLRLLGLNQRPENMIFTAFPVPPLCIRPVSISNRQRRQSELTEKLLHIVKQNILLQNSERDSYSYIQAVHELQKAINAYIVEEKNSGNKRYMSINDRKPVKHSQSLFARLRGKEGTIRGHLMGKRVNFCARTPIGPDPSLRIDEVGIPLCTAMSLTFPEKVTAFNIEKLYGLVRSGPYTYPGCNYVIRQDGSRMDLRVCGSNVRLSIGDTVERHLINGDVVLMNRAPSLHRMSIMAHYVRVDSSGTTKNMRLNLAVCTPYNADFDGDEMNLHVPQTQEARAEAELLNCVSQHIIDPKTSGPIMKLIQDAMFGCTSLSQPDCVVDFATVCNILCKIEYREPLSADRKRDWSGRELLSVAIPAGIYMFKAGDRDAGEEDVVIKDGQLISGVLCSSHINSRTGLTKIIHKELKQEAATQFLTNVQFIANEWMQSEGFSIGLSDVLLSKNTYDRVEAFKCNAEKELTENTSNVINQLDKLRDGCMPFVKEECEKTHNRIAQTVHAGSKGKIVNLNQLLACVGTQARRGQPLKPNADTGRTMPHYVEDEICAPSRGFIWNSYLAGLNMTDEVVHSMATREGLVDTAIKSVTGDTPIFIEEDNCIKRVAIGDWIDAKLEAHKDEVCYFEERNMELLKLNSNSIYVPTMDALGHVFWADITAVTRHDPGEQLFEIKTRSGRSVIVTESKSLLIYNEVSKRFVETLTEDVRVGDKLPVLQYLPYPHTPHICISPLHLKLDRDRGVFFGLYLASGCCNSNVVSFAEQDKGLRKFITCQFDKLSVRHEKRKITISAGIAETVIRGFSRDLVCLLNELMGDGHKNRRIPPEFLAAPDEFIVGLLDGYFSGAGSIYETSITAVSIDPILIEGVNALCNRLGIFAILSTETVEGSCSQLSVQSRFRISIVGPWLSTFRQLVGLTHHEKAYQMIGLQPALTHQSFPVQDDVVLDSITEINILPAADYPKVYDLTVPDTLNFGLANGLQVRDTSETGYIQRRLIKAMEDITVRYDGTVRRSDASIIQLQFGYHGLDPVHMEMQQSYMHKLSFEELTKKYIWSDADSEHCLREEKQAILKLWNYATEHEKELDERAHSITAAFSVKRLMWEAQARFPTGELLHRRQAIQLVNSFAKSLQTQALQLHVDQGVLIHHWLLMENLSSKLLMKREFTVEALKWLLERMEWHFQHSGISPGEAIGIIAAQSIGSLATQMTLDTFHHCGQTDMDITLGVPRMREIVNMQDTKQPRLSLTLKAESKRPHNLLRLLKEFIIFVKHCTPSTVFTSVEVLDMNSDVISRELYVQINHLIMEDDEYKQRLSHAVLRCCCNWNVVQLVEMSVIKSRIQKLLNDENYIVMATDDNDEDNAVIHIRYLHPLTAHGRVRQAKVFIEKVSKAADLLNRGSTMLLPIGTQDRPLAQLVDGERLVISSAEFGNELLLLKYTDPLKSYCNDFKVVAKVLGIEAARNVIREEAKKVFNFGGDSILEEHINLFIDVVTYTGVPIGATRTGVIKHQSVGPLQQSSFEVTSNVLRKAAAFCTTDKILGVSERIMVGKPPAIGTHCDLDLISIQKTPVIPLCEVPDITAQTAPSMLEGREEEEEEQQQQQEDQITDVNFESIFNSVSGFHIPQPYGSMIGVC